MEPSADVLRIRPLTVTITSSPEEMQPYVLEEEVPRSAVVQRLKDVHCTCCCVDDGGVIDLASGQTAKQSDSQAQGEHRGEECYIQSVWSNVIGTYM